MEQSPFPISYWSGVPERLSSPERYIEVAEAGFTVAKIAGSADSIRTAMDWCREAGITAMVADQRMPRRGDLLPGDWRERLRAIVDDYGQHPALWGYHFMDEPHPDDFPALAELTAELRGFDMAHPAYVNLLPNYARPPLLGNVSYKEYVQRFIDAVDPDLVSYDHYALLDDGATRPEYFENLALVRSAAREAQLPFWQVILSTPHFHYRDPTEADLRWQVWTSLAYGARGISYYTYWTPSTHNYRNGLISQFGSRTAKYDTVRQVNLELQIVGPLLQSLTSLGVVHSRPTGELMPGPTAIREPEYLAHGMDHPMIIGEFRGAEQEAVLVVVNGDLARSNKAAFATRPEYVAMRIVDRTTGMPGPRLALDRGHELSRGQLWLSPGDGAIVILER